MKIATIVPSDNIVIIDGQAATVDCSSVDPAIHAIQWDEIALAGAIEFVDANPYDGQVDPPERIDSIAPWQVLIDAAIIALTPPAPES